ncbi:MAG: tetratricopeptide repeat protein [Limisphaerales bacterium]
MKHYWNIIATVALLLTVVALFARMMWRALKRSDDPGRLIWKLGITGFLLVVLIGAIFPVVAKFDYTSAAMIPYVAAIAIIIGLIWAPSWASMLVSPITGAIDGGIADGEVTPQYSIAEAKRVRGQYNEAALECRKQLERFPTDLRLQLLLAEIQAEHLNDLQAAESIVMHISQQKHSAANIFSAFLQLADWHLKMANDPDSARQTLERIISMFPESQFAQTAAQRIAHLGSANRLIEHHDRPTLKLKDYERVLGLKVREDAEAKPAENHRAKDLLEHLRRHPMDNDAREELALIYAEQYQRVDMAVDQLEELINRPNQKTRDLVHWLNLCADLHVKFGNDAASAEAALRRIIDRFPNTAGAEMANRRMATLNGELNRNKKSQAIKLGSYERDLGLKGKRPIGQPRVE